MYIVCIYIYIYIYIYVYIQYFAVYTRYYSFLTFISAVKS